MTLCHFLQLPIHLIANVYSLQKISVKYSTKIQKWKYEEKDNNYINYVCAHPYPHTPTHTHTHTYTYTHI